MSTKLVMCFVALVVVAACSGSSASPSSAPATALATAVASQEPSTAVATPASPTPAPTPASFTSPLYAYTVAVPAGWDVGPAMLRWDGASAPSSDASEVDKFASPTNLSIFGFAAPEKSDIATFVKQNIAWTVRDHGDTCPAKTPEKTESVKIGSQDGRLLSWDCGILINQALLVSHGTGYVFVMRDPDVHAATDATDRAILDGLLGSVTLPR
jgi:hypothetical protein